jgi:hypothetical protein
MVNNKIKDFAVRATGNLITDVGVGLFLLRIITAFVL